VKAASLACPVSGKRCTRDCETSPENTELAGLCERLGFAPMEETRELPVETTEEIMQDYELPQLPPAYYGPGARQLRLFRMRGGTADLGEPVSLEDAKEYCDLEETHGDGWFVGFDQANEEED
jgi:hypothetical protein